MHIFDEYLNDTD